NIESKDSYDSNFDELDLQVTPLFDANKDECFDLGGDDDEINVLDFHYDSSIPVMSVSSILEGFIDEPPLEENDDLFDLEPKNNDWKNILYDAPIFMTDDNVFHPEIHDQNFSPTYVSLPFEDRHYLFFTYVIQIVLLYFTYPMVSNFLLYSGSKDTIFDLDISAFHFSHRCGTFKSFNVYPNILNESPMKICSSTCFYPNIMMIWGKGFSRVETPLFEGMPVNQEVDAEEDADKHIEKATAGDVAQGDDTAAYREVPIVTQEPSIPSPTPPTPPAQLPQEPPLTSQVQHTPLK
nr:hypothetical protein [Tanacetum cinerariifolium]